MIFRGCACIGDQEVGLLISKLSDWNLCEQPHVSKALEAIELDDSWDFVEREGIPSLFLYAKDLYSEEAYVRKSRFEKLFSDKTADSFRRLMRILEGERSDARFCFRGQIVPSTFVLV